MEGDTAVGPELVLLDQDDDLIAGTPWAESGYAVLPFLDAGPRQVLVDSIKHAIFGRMRAAGIEVGDDYPLDQYHTMPGLTPELHHAFIERIRKSFPLDGSVDMAPLIERMSDICGVRVTSDAFCVRVVRPQSGDNNPPHRDVWLDTLRHRVNIYAPIAGSTLETSLPVLPGSHRWPESMVERTTGGANIGGVAYTVPAATRILGQEFNMVRPNPGEGEFLVFSPYMIHGGARNLSRNLTRVSLEMRFWRA